MVDEEQIVDSLPEQAGQNIIEMQKRPAVLVVDDEPRILTSMTALLEDDFAVLTSTNAQTALGLLKHQQIAVIIADQRMPGLTGDEFLSKAKDLSHATRILITGYADINALIKAVNHGQIYTYIAKPWQPAELRMAVIKAAEYCRLSREVERERSLLHALMNNIPDAIWFKDNDFRFTQVNRAAASLLGVREPFQAVGKTIFDFLPLEQAQEVHAQEQEIIKLGRPEINRLNELQFNGVEPRWMSTTRAPVMERTGDVAAMVGVSRDVTEQRRAELALQQSEEKYRQIVETASEGVWILDDHLRTVFVNQEMAAMLDLRPEDMLGKSLAHFMPAEDAPAQIEQFKWPDTCKNVDLRLRKSDGTLVWAMLSTSPMIDSCGRQSGTLAMLSNVTRRKELEQNFLQAQKMEVVGRLAAGIAHDFNNLLTVINTYSQLLLGRFNEQHPAWREIHEIHSAGERSATLTQRLLAMGRQPAQQPKVFDLNLMLGGLQHILKRLIGDDIRLTLRLDPASSAIEANQDQIEHIVMNLSINARDAMPDGGDLLISSATRSLNGADAAELRLPPSTYVELAVTDTGHGMDERTKAKVFEAFFTTKEIGRGTGLGLWMAREIIERSRGSIAVDSTPGRGSTFRIYLPLAGKQMEPVSSPLAATGATTPLQSILVVEEDPNTQKLIQESLASAGYRVLLADEKEAGALIHERAGVHIDLLIYGVGVLLGIDPAARLAAVRPGMKLLFLFNEDEVPADKEPWPVGAAYQQKPCQGADLVQRVREVLDTPSGYSILIADDDRAIRNVLGDVLRPLGYSVIEASNGRQAIAQMQQKRINLLITDLVMPEQEGLETIRAAKKKFPDLKIIAMSGGFGERYLELAKVLGADKILSKPFRMEVLRESVRHFACGSPASETKA